MAALQAESVLPAAEAILTTDLYPKVRRAAVGEGSIVGIAKGAGMIEPDLATMLVYLLTDLSVPREELRAALDEAVEGSFQCITVDSDTSTSDTVALVSSMRRPAPRPAGLPRGALPRGPRPGRGRGPQRRGGAPRPARGGPRRAQTSRVARAIGKSVVNSPLVQCAVNGNDPNVGRLLAAIGKQAGRTGLALDPAAVRLRLGGETIFEEGAMRLDPEKERRLHQHMKEAELYASVPPPDGLTFRPPVDYPPHERSVEIEIDLGLGAAAAEVLGADRSHEYVTENADYRS